MFQYDLIDDVYHPSTEQQLGMVEYLMYNYYTSTAKTNNIPAQTNTNGSKISQQTKTIHIIKAQKKYKVITLSI